MAQKGSSSLPYTTSTLCGLERCRATIYEPESWTPTLTRGTLEWRCPVCKYTTLDRFERNASSSLFELTARYTFLADNEAPPKPTTTTSAPPSL